MAKNKTVGLKAMSLIRSNLQRLGLLEEYSDLLVESENYFEPCHSMPRGHVEVIYNKLAEQLILPKGFVTSQEMAEMEDGEFISLENVTKENLEAFLTYYTFEGWSLLFKTAKDASSETVSTCIDDVCDTVLVLSMQLYLEGCKQLAANETIPNRCFKQLEHLFYKELGNMYTQLMYSFGEV